MARRMDKLEKVDLIKLDGHAHIYSNPRPRANKFWRDPGKRTLEFLIKNMKRNDINSVAITNAGDDWNYERFTIQAKKLPKDWRFYQDDRITQVIDADGENYIFIKAEELFPKEGHLLVWGTKFGQMYQPKASLKEYEEKVSKEFLLNDLLDILEKDSILTIISDHTDYDGGLGARGVLNDEKIRNRIHAYEFNFSVDENSRMKTVERVERERKPAVVGSDCHRPRYVGYAYTLFFGDFGRKNGEDFVASLKQKVLYRQNKGGGQQIPKLAQLHHFYMLAMDHKILKLYNKDVATDDFDIDEEIIKFNSGK